MRLNESVDDAPSEFRLFRPGINATSKGEFLFDDAAAKSVMAAYERHGTQLMVDLEHLSLNPESNSYDPDARAWAELEVRGGELWAVNVKWTEDGAARLSAKSQRYVSPAFEVDEDNRITSILNIALVGMPATHQPAALVAANQLVKANMNLEVANKAIEMIAAGDSDGALALLQDMVAQAASGEEAEASPAEEPDAAMSEPEAGEEPDEMSQLADEPAEDEEKKKDVEAMSQLFKLSNTTDREELVEKYRALSARVDEIDAREKAAEEKERKSLVASLVKLGAELPTTAWEGEEDDRKVCSRLANEDLDSLRGRVKALSAARPKVNRPPAKPPVVLSAADQAACKKLGISPEEFAARKAAAVKRNN